MRIIIEGTREQINDVCREIISPGPRDRSALAARRAADNERNRRESELMRRAFLAVKDDPKRKELANRFAAAIYGKRPRDLLLVAQTILVGDYILDKHLG